MEKKIDKLLWDNEILEKGEEFEAAALTTWSKSSEVIVGWNIDKSCWYWGSVNKKWEWAEEML